MKKIKNKFAIVLSLIVILEVVPLNGVSAKDINFNLNFKSNITKNENDVNFYYQEDDNSSDTIIKTKLVNDTEYLFLPSQADYSRLKLKGNGQVLKGDIQNSQIIMSDELNKSGYNMTLLFGEMKPGEEYCLNVDGKDIYLYKSANLSAIYITSDKTIAEINASENKTVKGKGSLTKISKDGKSSGSLQLKQIKGRGNWSWYGAGNSANAKKPYGIKLDKKFQLVEGSDNKLKSWCLISDYQDNGVGCDIGYKIYEELGAKNYVTRERTDLYVNGEYRGNYGIVEKINDNVCGVTPSKFEVEGEDEDSTYKEKDLDPEEDIFKEGIQVYKYNTKSVINDANNFGGYVLELDFPNRLYEDGAGFILRSGTCFNIKEPEIATEEQVKMIARYAQEAEDALMSPTGYNNKGKHYSEYYDIDQLAKLWLIKTFMIDNDIFSSSFFFSIDVNYKHKLDNQKFIAGPAWDLETFASRYVKELNWYWDLYTEEQIPYITGNNHAGCYYGDNAYVTNACYANVLLQKSDFMKAAFDNYQIFKQISDNYNFDEIFNKSIISKKMEEIAGYEGDYQKFRYSGSINRFKDSWSFRMNKFNEALENAIMGVEIKKENNLLKSTVTNANLEDVEYQWYGININKNNDSENIISEPIDNANESTLILDSSNSSYDAYQLYATSKNIAYLKYNSSRRIEGYNFFDTITMYSNVCSNGTNIKFYDFYGNTIDEKNVDSYADISFPDIPTEVDNYLFVGWAGQHDEVGVRDREYRALYIKKPNTKKYDGKEVLLKTNYVDTYLDYDLITKYKNVTDDDEKYIEGLPKKFGKYIIKVTGVKGDGLLDVEHSIFAEIDKAKIDYTVSDNVEKVYDGVEESITVSVNNMSSDEYEVIISNEENSETSGISSLTNAGTLNAYVRIRPIGDAAGNYYSVGFGEGENKSPIHRTIKINKAEMPWSVSDSVIREYNGEEASINVSVDGFTSDMYEVIKGDSEEATTNAENTTLTNVGTITLYIKIRPIGTAANNYYSVGLGEGKTSSAVQRVITINPANITASVNNVSGPEGQSYSIGISNIEAKGGKEVRIYFSTENAETRPDDSTFTLDEPTKYSETGVYITWVRITADNHNSFYGKGTVTINDVVHKATYLDIDGNEITGTSQEVLSANEIVYPNAAEVEGYKFLGWSGKESKIAVEDVTFKATYVKDLKTKYVVGDTIEASIKPEDADINLTYSVINTAKAGEVSDTLPTLPGSYIVTIKPEEKTSQSNIKLQAGTKASNPKFVSSVEYSFDITYKKVTWLGDFNNETVIEEQNYVTLPSSIEEAPTPTPVTGYTFLGYLGDISKAIEEEVEMKAIYVKTSVSKVYDGEEVVIPTNYEKELKYNAELPVEIGEYAVGVSVEETGLWLEDIEVNININEKLFNVKFIDKDGNELGDFAQEVRYKADIVLPRAENIPEVEGYKFIGWYGYEELADELESDAVLAAIYIEVLNTQNIGEDIKELDINIPGAEIVYTYYDLEGNVLDAPPSIPGTYRVEATIMLNEKELTKTSFDVEFKNTQIPNIPIYRLYNPVSGEHLFTSKVGEYNKLPASGWVQEGMTFDAYAENNKPEDAIEVYRLFNPMGFGGMGDHHYTKSKGEINKLVKAGWSLDFDGKPAFYVAGKISVFKLYDKRTGAHHYTPKLGERKNMEKAGWVYEGEAWTVNGYYSNNGTQRTSDDK